MILITKGGSMVTLPKSFTYSEMERYSNELYDIGRAETLKEVMPILLHIVDEEGCYYGHQEEIEALEKEYLNNEKK